MHLCSSFAASWLEAPNLAPPASALAISACESGLSREVPLPGGSFTGGLIFGGFISLPRLNSFFFGFSLGFSFFGCLISLFLNSFFFGFSLICSTASIFSFGSGSGYGSGLGSGFGGSGFSSSSGGGLGSGSGSSGSCCAHGGTMVMSMGIATSGSRHTISDMTQKNANAAMCKPKAISTVRKVSGADTSSACSYSR
jgi:hypothetical protein